MTTPSPYGQPANPDPYATGYNQPVYPAAGQPYAQPAGPGPGPYATGYNQPVYPAAGQPYAPAYGPYGVPKSKTTAALLAFFLGGIGAHNFYRGQTGRGFGHIALVVVSIICIIMATAAAVDAVTSSANSTLTDSQAAGFGGAYIFAWLVIAANGIWAFVEFIMILVSKDGSLQ